MFMILSKFFSPIVALAIEAGVILSLVGGVWVSVKIHYENLGYSKAMHAVAVQTSKAAREGAKARDEVKACTEQGKMWVIEDDACE